MTRQHAVIHHPLSQKGNAFDANWLSLERQFNASFPICATATGNPGTIASGTPGVSSFLTFQPTALVLNDASHFIGASPNATPRIPLDGYYDFWLLWEIDDNISAVTIEFKTFLDFANTSDTGIGSPAWTRLITGPSRTFVNQNLDKFFEVLYRGVEMHANDLIRFGVQVYSGTSLTQTTVTQSEFRFVYPIPNETT